MSLPLPALALLGFAGAALAQVPAPEPFTPLRFGDPPDAAWEEPWFPGSTHDPDFPTFDQFLGAAAGSRIAHHGELLAACRAFAAASPRVRLVEHGTSHEGRTLFHLVITRPDRLADWEPLEAEFQLLADPRRLSAEEAEERCKILPAVAWLGYGIHGDETSGVDAAALLAWHLAAGTSPDVTELLDRLVVVIDPCLNPDGRQRFLAQLEQMAGYVTDLDHASLQRGRWPFGRGDHYLFDLNRDWIAGVAPETRARWATVQRYWPQLFVDGHEMHALDTFLFYPQAAAHHPSLPPTLLGWQGRLADQMARAFDAYGWAYYTREWADAWGPFYSDAWGSLTGAVGMLYEQARTAGRPVRRASGEIVPYREAVHGQVVASLASLRTLSAERSGFLRDFHRARRSAVEDVDRARVYVVPAGGPHLERTARLERLLQAQGIETRRVEAFALRDAVGALGQREERLACAAGSLLVPLSQPQGRLVSAFLDFDPQLPEAYLQQERTDLEQLGEGHLYDVTAWDLGRAFGLEAWWGQADWSELQPHTAPVVPELPAETGRVVGWALDGREDSSLRFAARALELGLELHASDRAFRAAGREFGRGSLLVRSHENGEDPLLAALVGRAARDAGVRVVPLVTGRSPDDGPDLGGGHFRLLERPRLAILSNDPVDAPSFGHLWRHLDVELGLSYTALDAAQWGSADLRRYNVLVLPSGDLGPWLSGHGTELRRWLEEGGTLVACGASAAALADAELGLSVVRRREDVLAEVPIYQAAARLDLAAGRTAVDPQALYAGTAGAAGAELLAEGDEADAEALARRDHWAERFAPSGAILRGVLDQRHWLTVGCAEQLPLIYSGARVLLHRGAVPVRLAEGEALRLGGLLWPEARDRLALGAYVTVESVGAGQVILFADDPVFRGYFLGTARLFGNAVVYGPGLGTDVPVPR
jgi:hypothetical protein